jgi:tetratricopeptide (TPR) repeat protein
VSDEVTGSETGTSGGRRGGGRSGGGTAARRAARDAQDAGRAGEPDTQRPPANARTDSAPATSGAPRRDAEVRRGLDPDAIVALEDERDFLLASLADLEREHDAGDVDDADYHELKDDYTARTAVVLRALQRRALASEAAPGRSWQSVVATVACVLLVAVVGGVLLARAAGTRGPGEGATGDIRLSTRDQLLQASQLTGQASQALRGGDSDQALDLYRQAIQLYQEVLEVQPDNVEALTYQGWLLFNVARGSDAAAAGELSDGALDLLDDAVQADPTFADARVFRALVHDAAGRYAAAQADLDALAPDAVPSFMAAEVARLRQRVAEGLAGPLAP